MIAIIYRSAVFLVLAAIGYQVGEPGNVAAATGLVFGGSGLALLLIAQYAMKKSEPLNLLGALSGFVLFAALGVGVSVTPMLEMLHPAVSFSLTLVLALIGMEGGARAANALGARSGGKGQLSGLAAKVLDTSALIDGRVVELAELSFLGGPIIVPQFVLLEAQAVADSPDALRRARGRRGLGSVERLKAMEGLDLRIIDEDYARESEVDVKLVAMCLQKKAMLVTTDFNLAKVAELKGVRVMNVNQLAQALRPVVLPGEKLTVTIQKSGKEPGQGVGYMEDGTMVVVDSAQAMMDRTLAVVVTSVLQTSAGKLIFAKMADEGLDSPERRAKNGGRA